MLPLASAMLSAGRLRGVVHVASRRRRPTCVRRASRGLPLSARAGFAASTGSLPRVEGVRGLLFNGCLATMAFLGSPGQGQKRRAAVPAGKASIS